MKYKLPLLLVIIIAFGSTKTFGTQAKSSDIKKPKIEFAYIKTQHGEVQFKFFPNKAPKTTARIKHLIQKGFYNGIKFHRVIAGFVAQAGDPTGTGSGGSGETIPAEFNDKKHVYGTVAMARKGNDINSADSQFYISLGVHPHLDNKYTIFGKVVKGMDVVEKIKQNDKIISIRLKSI